MPYFQNCKNGEPTTEEWPTTEEDSDMEDVPSSDAALDSLADILEELFALSVDAEYLLSVSQKLKELSSVLSSTPALNSPGLLKALRSTTFTQPPTHRNQ